MSRTQLVLRIQNLCLQVFVANGNEVNVGPKSPARRETLDSTDRSGRLQYPTIRPDNYCGRGSSNGRVSESERLANMMKLVDHPELVSGVFPNPHISRVEDAGHAGEFSEQSPD